MQKNARMHLAAMLFGIGAALAAAPSFAHCGGDMGMGPMGGHARGDMVERMKQHQQRVHDALKLTPQQQGAWTKFQESHPFMRADLRPDPAELAKLSAPERAEKMLERQKQHQEAMTQHVAALKEFYGQLTPEQQKIFDEQTRYNQRAQRRAPRN